jgi:hypothetical protein
MREAIAIILFITSLVSYPQERKDAISRVNATIDALAAARKDEVRDSLNSVLKTGLRELLSPADAATISLDSLRLSRIDAPDGKFKLITWNIPRENGSHHYEGFLLQIEKRPVLHELMDATSVITSPEVPELGVDKWYGALYYEVVPVKKGGKTYYTLLGWKGHDAVETRKVIEVLHFKGSKPRFGAPLFGTGKLKRNRQVFGYSFQATMALRHQPGLGIILDHLSPSRPDLEGQRAFYGPDMSFDAYVWEKGQWIFQRDVDARDRNRSSKPFNPPPPPPGP